MGNKSRKYPHVCPSCGSVAIAIDAAVAQCKGCGHRGREDKFRAEAQRISDPHAPTKNMSDMHDEAWRTGRSDFE